MNLKPFILFIGAALGVRAQQTGSQLPQTTRDMLNLGGVAIGSNNTSVAFFGLKGPKGDVIGNPYLDSAWQAGSIKLFQKIGPPGREGDSIANVSLRLDVHANELEIKAGPDIRVVGGNQVRFFTLEGPERRIFMNAMQFRSEDKLPGFVELIQAGRVSLVEYTKLNIIKPSYNEALGTGTKDTKITKSGQYYVAKGNTLVQIGTSKKKLLEALADRADDVEKFIKTNDISLRSRTDMAKVFAYYNSL